MATSVDQLDDVTITACCALPTSASCCTSKGVGAGDFVGVGAGFVGLGFVGLGFAVGFGDVVAVGLGLGRGLGVGVVATTSGDGTDAGELATSALATELSGALAGLAIADLELAAAVTAAEEPTADVEPADDGWLLVQAASAAAQRITTTQRAGVGLLVRSRRAIVPG